MAGMNPTSLYITSNQIILKSNPKNLSTWQDLYRLVPDLRNSLCCVVCDNLLIDPQTPTIGKCQHHLCRKCKDGEKKINPACVWCKYCKNYSENKILQTLLQCYKRMCIMLIHSGIFQRLVEQASQSNLASNIERGAGNLIMLIKEGAAFQDDNQVNARLSKLVYNTLPCIFTNSSTQTNQPRISTNSATQTNQLCISTNSSTQTNQPWISKNSSTQTSQLNQTGKTKGMSGKTKGSGKKITIKRKPKKSSTDNKINKSRPVKKDSLSNGISKKPSKKKILKSHHGCRCGTTTAIPGLITCFGQRCLCYSENKSCIDCKCRGCKNPYRPDGTRVRPYYAPHTEIFQPISLADFEQEQQLQLEDETLLPEVTVEMVPTFTIEELEEHLMLSNINGFNSYTKIPTSLPHAILANDSETTDSEDEEITTDF